MRRILITQPTAERLKAYEGQFYSAELGVTYDVFVRDARLKFTIRGETSIWTPSAMTLSPGPFRSEV